VLVHCYHGLGDTIHFARFLPMLARTASDVVVWAQPELVELLRTMPDVRAVLPLHDGAPDVERDVDIESMELAHALRIVPSDLADNVPYFHVPAADRPSTRYSAGVLLTAGGWSAQRSMPRVALGALEDSVDWFSLELGAPLAGMREFSTPYVVVLASRLQSLDLVITVDTMLAHLAGALGVPTWTLLPHDADWRWQVRRADTDTLWYPTMRLFRQPRPGDWASVAQAIHAELRCAR